MFSGNVKMAFGSVRRARWRSLMTMFGIIVGITSVVTIVSLGEGVKRQMVSQIDHLGPNVITIRPGKVVTRRDGEITKVNLTSLFGGGTLSEKDLTTTQKTEGVKVAVPTNVVAADVTADGVDFYAMDPATFAQTSSISIGIGGGISIGG